MRIVMVVFIFKEPELKYADAEEQGKEYMMSGCAYVVCACVLIIV